MICICICQCTSPAVITWRPESVLFSVLPPTSNTRRIGTPSKRRPFNHRLRVDIAALLLVFILLSILFLVWSESHWKHGQTSIAP